MKLNLHFFVLLIISLQSCAGKSGTEADPGHQEVQADAIPVKTSGDQRTNNCDTTWHEKNKPKEIICYEDSARHGEYFRFDKNGKVLIEGFYSKGLRNGTWKQFGHETPPFYDNNTKSYIGSGSFDHDENYVLETLYRNDSIIKTIGRTWFPGKRNLASERITLYGADTLAVVTQWYDNGKLYAIAKEKNGYGVDTIKTWRNDGTLERIDIQGDLGITMITREYDATGKKVTRELVFDKKTNSYIEKKQ